MRVSAMRCFATRPAHPCSAGTFALLVALSAGPVRAQDTAISLVVERGGAVVGTESFTLRSSRPRNVPGTWITSTVRSPAGSPGLQLSTNLERTSELAIAKFQMDVDSAGTSTVILAAGSGTRLIVRTVAKGAEAGRELPGGRDVVLLDDAVYALYAQVADLATAAGRSLTAVYPRTGQRTTFTARREEVDDNIKVVMTGGISGTLVTDSRGRLVRLDLPTTKTVVKRSTAETRRESVNPSR